MKFFPQIYALFCRILSRQAFTHCLTVLRKNPQHTCSKWGRGESKAVLTMFNKNALLVSEGFPTWSWWGTLFSIISQICDTKPIHTIVFHFIEEYHYFFSLSCLWPLIQVSFVFPIFVPLWSFISLLRSPLPRLLRISLGGHHLIFHIRSTNGVTMQGGWFCISPDLRK